MAMLLGVLMHLRAVNRPLHLHRWARSSLQSRHMDHLRHAYIPGSLSLHTLGHLSRLDRCCQRLLCRDLHLDGHRGCVHQSLRSLGQCLQVLLLVKLLGLLLLLQLLHLRRHLLLLLQQMLLLLLEELLLQMLLLLLQLQHALLHRLHLRRLLVLQMRRVCG